MKKLVALILAAIMVMCWLPSLAEDVDNPYEEYGVEVIRDAEGNVVDLGGMEIVICEHWSHDWHEDEENADYEPTAYEEATWEYRTWIEETYNCKIYCAADTDWGNCPDDFIKIATTGTDKNYVWAMRWDAFLPAFRQGLYYDLSTLDCLDLTAEKWNKTVEGMTTDANGGIHGLKDWTEPRLGVFFNKKLLKEAGVDPESIYDMQKDGTWTWEAFEKILIECTKDTDNDGITDKYAMMSFSPRVFQAALNSNNASVFSMDENGKFTVTADKDNFLEAANWIVEMIKKYEMPAPEGANWDYFDAAFLNGETAIKVAEDYERRTLSQSDIDYGFVMFPKGPSADTYKHAPTDNVYVIPANYDAERAWKIAFAYNLYTEPTPGYTWKDLYYDTYKDKRAVDETLTMMMEPEHQMIGTQSLVSGFDFGGQYCWDVYGLAKTPAEKIAESMPTWQGLAEEANSK